MDFYFTLHTVLQIKTIILKKLLTKRMKKGEIYISNVASINGERTNVTSCQTPYKNESNQTIITRKRHTRNSSKLKPNREKDTPSKDLISEFARTANARNRTSASSIPNELDNVRFMHNQNTPFLRKNGKSDGKANAPVTPFHSTQQYQCHPSTSTVTLSAIHRLCVYVSVLNVFGEQIVFIY